MTSRFGCALMLACVMTGVSARPAHAQQTLNLSVGYVMLPGEGRVATDVLLIEHADLLFEVNDFNGRTIGGEWLRPFWNRYEFGVGLSHWQRTVDTIHARLVNSDGTSVPRQMGLRQLPIAFTARVLPLGQAYRVQPYLGGGIVVVNWRFSESGDFVNAANRRFRDESYSAVGTAAGPVMLLGLRLAGESVAYGIEGRYYRARGSFGPGFAHVQDPDIDLGGWTLQATAGLRFGN